MARKALFLDRDGVINVDHGYVHRIEDFQFVPGILEVLLRARAAGYVLVVVTNQAGIARGYYDEDQFRTLTDWMTATLAGAGAAIERVYHCPHHPDGLGHYRRHCDHRKPMPGMILKAAAELHLDLSASLLVGDKETDIEAGRRAGVGRCVLFSPDPVVATDADVVIRALDELIPLLVPGPVPT